MKQKIEKIAKQIKLKLPSGSSQKDYSKSKEVDHFIAKFDASTEKSCVYFLLALAVELNQLPELHELLELNILQNINEPLLFKHQTSLGYKYAGSHGKTLLGIAAFYDHILLVKYLIQTQSANLNAVDINGNTPLHQSVYGDSYVLNSNLISLLMPEVFEANSDNSRELTVSYLLRCGADIMLVNSQHKTPYDCAKAKAPLWIEKWIGYRFITNMGLAQYYADKVRPILEKELNELKKADRLSNRRTSSKTIVETKNYEEFCREQAIEEYIKKGSFPDLYENLEAFLAHLKNLSKKEWDNVKQAITLQKPTSHRNNKYWLMVGENPIISLVFLSVFSLIVYAAINTVIKKDFETNPARFSQSMIFFALVAAICGTYILSRGLSNVVSHKLKDKQSAAEETRINQLLECNPYEPLFKPEPKPDRSIGKISNNTASQTQSGPQIPTLSYGNDASNTG